MWHSEQTIKLEREIVSLLLLRWHSTPILSTENKIEFIELNLQLEKKYVELLCELDIRYMRQFRSNL